MRFITTHRGSRKLLLAAVAAVASLATIAPASGMADTTIGTVGAYEANPGSFYEFGDPNTATYGQVVTVPAGESALTDFTFYLQEPPGLEFRAYVYAWDGEKATGPALYEGPDMHTTDESLFQPITAETGGVTVTPGAQYVLFYSVSKDEEADKGTALEGGWGEAPQGSYTEGSLVYINNEYEPAAWTSQSWDVESNSSFAFSATFTEPTTTPVTPTKTVTTTTTTTPTLVAPTPSVPAPVNCVVPTLRGMSRAAVEGGLAAAHCKLGAILYHYNTLAKGGLVEQSLHQGTIAPDGTGVSVWFSLGGAPKHHRHASHHH